MKTNTHAELIQAIGAVLQKERLIKDQVRIYKETLETQEGVPALKEQVRKLKRKWESEVSAL